MVDAAVGCRPALDQLGDEPQARRSLCARCSRPPAVCVCAALPGRPLLLRRCRVVLLQHWREAKKKKIMGTAPIVTLCCDPGGVAVLVDHMASDDGTDALTAAATAALFPELGRALGIVAPTPPPLPPLLLFPGEGARSLSAVLGEQAAVQSTAASASDAAEKDDRQVLIVLDGTWKQAKQLWWRHRVALERAQRVVIMGAGASRFEKIRRREPAPGCVSTLEALAAALALLEASTTAAAGSVDDTAEGTDGMSAAGGRQESVADVLLRAFDELVQVQSRFVPAPLCPEDYHKQRVSASGPALPLATEEPVVPAQHEAAAATSDCGSTLHHRVRAYAMCLTRTCALTATKSLVPVGVSDPGFAARMAAAGDDCSSLSEGEALAAGLLWCTQTEAAAACQARNVAEQRKRGQRFVSLQACNSLVSWSAL